MLAEGFLNLPGTADLMQGLGCCAGILLFGCLLVGGVVFAVFRLVKRQQQQRDDTRRLRGL